MDDVENIGVYTTYEVSYLGIKAKETEASRDAIQLLKCFSFMHFGNIQMDILRRAVTNKRLEEKQDRKSKQKPLEDVEVAQSWSQTIRSMKLAILTFLFGNRGPAVLPHLIRDARKSASFDDVRLRFALKELVQMSLVTYNDSNDSYSMHPLVHKWARERPGMTTLEQGVWSHAAAALIAHSILLPPLGRTEADEDFHGDLLPHIDHVRMCQHEVQHRVLENQFLRSKPWPISQTKLDRDQALIYAKFSLIYAQCGKWAEAEMLQSAVKSFCYEMLGIEHANTRQIMLSLAETYWHLGRGDEAAELQESVLQACIALLGRTNRETLNTMDTLGQTRWQQGRYTDARKLQEEAVQGLTRLLGRDHEDTLSAIDNLGRSIARLHDQFHDAKALHMEAVNGMKKTLGSTHLKTLVAIENLAGLGPHLGEDFLHPASDMITEVFEQRKKKLGKEHPYTLLAMVNMAKIKCALGQLKEAEDLLRTGLPIADRNLGENHIGTLYGRYNLGAVLVRQARYREAEELLIDIIERQKHLSSSSGDFHPDRLGAMIELVECYKLQGKIDDSIRVCDEALLGFRTITSHEHPLAKKLERDRRELVTLQSGKQADTVNTSAIPRHQSKGTTW